jgi:hypothetical protein
MILWPLWWRFGQGVAIRANLEKSLTRRRWHAKSDLLMEAITFFAGDFHRWRWRLWWLLFRQSLMDFIGVLLEIFTIFWVLLHRERVKGLILVGVAGATPWPNGGPWGWSGHPQEPYNKQNKILLYYFNFYLF